MLKQAAPDSLCTALGSDLTERWAQHTAACWLQEHGWGHVVDSFQDHGICGKTFLNLSLAHLADIVPRKLISYADLRRLHNQIQRLRIRTTEMQKQQQQDQLSWMSINTNVYGISAAPITTTMCSRNNSSSSISLPLSSLLSSHAIATKYNSAKVAIASRLKNPFGVGLPPAITADRCRRRTRKQTKFAWSSASAAWRHPKKESLLDVTMTASAPQPSRTRPCCCCTATTVTTQEEERAQIQVTGNCKVWYTIAASDICDARGLQDRILECMDLKGRREDYHYYYENGPDPEHPLPLAALQNLCTMATESSRLTIRVRVYPISIEPAANADPNPCTTTLTDAFSDILSTPDLTPSSSPTSPHYPYSYEPIQFSDPPTPRCDPSLPLPSFGPPASVLKPAAASYEDLWTATPFMPQLPAQLWAVPPRHQKKDDPKKMAAFWGERPPAEIVCQNMDTYFDDHDLDKTITVSSSLLLQRPLAHCKSLRALAHEATQKYTADSNTSTLHQQPIRRRKSTKIWGQTIVEVKPKGKQTNAVVVCKSAAAAAEQQKEEEVQQWFRGKLIGKGSFGRVYLAFNAASSEVIAVKQVPKSAWCAQDEIRMLQDLDHDNVVEYLGYGHEEDVVNIFLEYVAGGSIQSRLNNHGAFDEPLVRFFTRQILQGLAYLHSKNIMHRDIKTANILVEEGGTCKISDFGVSMKKQQGDDEQVASSSSSSLRGSVYWMAPEVVKNVPYGAKVDIWSLGCAVIEMFTGQRPWFSLDEITTLYHLGCCKTPHIPEHLSEGSKDFLAQCFTIDPNKRPTAASLLNHHAFCRPDPAFRFTDYLHRNKV